MRFVEEKRAMGMLTDGVVAWRTISTDEIRRVAFAFYRAHPECGTMVHTERGELSMVCWCECCKDLRAYQIDTEQRGSSPVA